MKNNFKNNIWNTNDSQNIRNENNTINIILTNKKNELFSLIKQKKVIAGIITKYGVAHKKSLIPS